MHTNLHLHTIYPGAINNIQCSIATGRLLAQDDFLFIVYTSTDAVIFVSQDLKPIQKISSRDIGLQGHLEVTALAVSDFCGYVAIAFANKLALYHSIVHRQLLSWEKCIPDPICFNSTVTTLTFNKMGTGLLVNNGCLLTLFRISKELDNHYVTVYKVWEKNLSTSANLLKFSPDGLLFASCGEGDQLVKVWSHKNVNNNNKNLKSRVSFCYLKHSSPVVGFSWRDTHFYMPKNCVPNILLTHTLDNCAQIWLQQLVTLESKDDNARPISFFHCNTIVPQSNISFVSSLSASIFPFCPIWVNNKVIMFSDGIVQANKNCSPSNKDDIKSKSHTNSNTVSDIRSGSGVFEGQLPIDEFKSIFKTDTTTMNTHKHIHTDLTLLDSTLPAHFTSQLLKKWRCMSDHILAINPLDGSILVWSVDDLDDTFSTYTVKKHSLISRMPNNLSTEDAQNLVSLFSVALYPTPFELQYRETTHKYSTNISNSDALNSHVDVHSTTNRFLVDRLYFLSTHKDGSINVWHGIFSEKCNNSCIPGLVHMGGLYGHSRSISTINKHPLLPLVATSSQGNKFTISHHASDLILWRNDNVGLLNYTGGLKPLAKLTSTNFNDFTLIEWFPCELLMKPNILNNSSNNSNSTNNSDNNSNNNNNIDVTLPTGTFVLTDISKCLSIYLVLFISPVEILNCNKDNHTYINRNYTSDNEILTNYSTGKTPSYLFKLNDVIHFDYIHGEIVSVHIYNGYQITNSIISTTHCINTSTTCDHIQCSLTESVFYIILYVNCQLISQPFDNNNKNNNNNNNNNNKKEKPITDIYIWKCEFSFAAEPNRARTISYNRQSSRVTLYYDFLSNLSNCLSVSSKQIYNGPFPNTSTTEKTCYIQHICKIADSFYNTSFLNSSYLFTSIDENFNMANWNLQHNNDSEITLVHYPSYKSCDINLIPLIVNPELKSGLCTDSINIISITKANANLLALLYYKHLNNPSIIILTSEENCGMQWKSDGEIELPDSKFYYKTTNIQLDWISCNNGKYMLVVLHGNSILIYAKCFLAHFKRNLLISANNDLEKNSALYYHLKTIEEQMRQNKIENVDINSTLWVNINNFEIPINRLSEMDNISIKHINNGLLLIAIGNFILTLSPWLNASSMFDAPIITNINSTIVETSFTRSIHPTQMEIPFSIFDVNEYFHTSLPFYHPFILNELVQFGQINYAQSILLYLSKCIIPTNIRHNTIEKIPIKNFEETLDTMTQYANLYDYSDLDSQLFKETHNNETDNNEQLVTKINYIPPISIARLLQSTDDMDSESSSDFHEFNNKIPVCLLDTLNNCELPELNNMEMIELRAIVDSLGSGKLLSKQSDIPDTINDMHTTNIIDETGFKYRLALKRYSYCNLNRNRDSENNNDDNNSMSYIDYAWAFHSVEQGKLLSEIPCVAAGEPEWEELRSVGVLWWLRNIEDLRGTIERLAKRRFSIRNDPLDAALFYLVMKKQSVIKHLFRTSGNSRMADFFANDFSIERWRKAAAKNAFKLMSHQRFEKAVAFFLLGNLIWDAIEVCIHKLGDFQLALLITRMFEGDRGSHYIRLLKEYVLGITESKTVRVIPHLHKNPYIRSMVYWQLDDYTMSINTITQDYVFDYTSPVFHFYFYLKSHPLILKCQQISSVNRRPEMGLSESEIRIIFQTISHYFNKGCPLLATLMLHKYKNHHFILHEKSNTLISSSLPHAKNSLSDQILSGTLGNDLFSQQQIQNSDAFDWSQPASMVNSDSFLFDKASDVFGSNDTSFQMSFDNQEELYLSKMDTVDEVVSTEKPFNEKKCTFSNDSNTLDLTLNFSHLKLKICLLQLCGTFSRYNALGSTFNELEYHNWLPQLKSFFQLELNSIYTFFENPTTNDSNKLILRQLSDHLFYNKANCTYKQPIIMLCYLNSMINNNFCLDNNNISTNNNNNNNDEKEENFFSIQSIPLFLSSVFPSGYSLNLIDYIQNLSNDLFHFLRYLKFPTNHDSMTLGINILMHQSMNISISILACLNSLLPYKEITNCNADQRNTSFKKSPGSTSTCSIITSWPDYARSDFILPESVLKKITITLAESAGVCLVALFSYAYMINNIQMYWLLLQNLPDEKMWYCVFGGKNYAADYNQITANISIINYYLTSRNGESPMNTFSSFTNQHHPVYNMHFINSASDYSSGTNSSSRIASDSTSHISDYMWNLISLCMLKKIFEAIKHLAIMVGIESELLLKSPLLCELKVQLQRWEKDLTDSLLSAGEIANQLKSSSSSSNSSSSSIRCLLSKHFRYIDKEALTKEDLPKPTLDLLEYLEREEDTRDMLASYIHARSDKSLDNHQKIRVLFRNEDQLQSFCSSNANSLLIALSTTRFIYEIDATRAQGDGESWIEEPEMAESADEVISKAKSGDDFLVIYQSQGDKKEGSFINTAVGTHEQSGVNSSVLLKRSQNGVKTMESHPDLPYYLCGTNDGSVHLCQFSNEGIVQCLFKTNSQITAMHFTQQGNKFGILDKDGTFASCQGIYTSMSQPHKLIVNCHSRSSEDFCYLSSSSFIATCGSSGDSANVRFWDLLMPQRRMIIKQFYCHTDGAAVLAYSPRHQQVISGGRKGDVCIFDIRQQSLIQKLEAHTDCIKAIALNTSEDFYVTGSANGSAKLWGLTIHNPITKFEGLHGKSSIFRSDGINSLSITDEGYLLSCGGDGTLKLILLNNYLEH